MGMAGRCAPHFLFETSKRKCAAPGGKEKMFSGSVCASADLLPPAGEGWLSLAAVRDGNALPLGKPLIWGSWGYPQRLSPLPLTLLRRTASGSENRRWSMRQPPRRGRHHPPRGGSADFAEEYSVPEGRPKSGQAPIRRPPCARRATAPECAQRFFLFHRARRILFLGKTKKRMGGASPAGAEPLSIPAPFHRSHKTTSAALSFCGRHRCHFHRSPWTIPLSDLRRRQRLPCAGIRCPGP